MNLPNSFRRYGAVILGENPSIVHTWTARPYGCDLSLPSQSENGFDIKFEVAADSVLLFWGNGHSHFERTDDIPALIEQLFGLLRDLLSPHMRIRQHYAGQTPYRQQLEAFDGSKWVVEMTQGLLLWNYFAKRTIKIYSNSILAGRMGTSVKPALDFSFPRPE